MKPVSAKNLEAAADLLAAGIRCEIRLGALRSEQKARAEALAEPLGWHPIGADVEETGRHRDRGAPRFLRVEWRQAWIEAGELVIRYSGRVVRADGKAGTYMAHRTERASIESISRQLAEAREQEKVSP